MADIAHILETMHPMREPPPPAAIVPHLALLAFGCAAAVTLLFVIWRIRHRRSALRSSAMAALAASRKLAPSERLAAQANLLRRLVRSLAGDAAARIQGEAWLQRLDAIFDTQFFTKGEGAAFGEALYRRPRDLDVETLDAALNGFIAKVLV